MSDIKHTPGPWRVEQNTTFIWGACNPDDPTTRGMGFPIAYARMVSSDREIGVISEAEANARLIAAAPDGYAFAKALDASWSETLPLGPDAYSEGNVTIGEEHAELWRQCRAFIAKAEGRT
jgi:hypothetical protein